MAYGTRTGQLPDDTLMAAVTSAEAALATNPPGDVRARLDELAAALNRGLRAIAPVTLLDLGSTWRPYPATHSQLARRVAFAVLGLLIIATAYYTQIYTQTNSVISQLSEIQSRNANDKFEHLYRSFVRHYKVIFSNGPEGKDNNDSEKTDAVVFESYLRSYDDLLALNNKVVTYVALSTELQKSFNVPLLSSALTIGERPLP